MSEALYAKIGRQTERLEQLDGAYTTLLNLLANVVAGDIDRSRVLVNLTERSWTLAPEGQRPSTPATINGLPVVIVAPAPEVKEAEPVEEPATDVNAA